jgi:hypothetical protein
VEKLLLSDDKDIKKVSPNLSKFKLRLPLILFPWAGGLVSGLTASIIKIAAEFFQANGIG